MAMKCAVFPFIAVVLRSDEYSLPCVMSLRSKHGHAVMIKLLIIISNTEKAQPLHREPRKRERIQ